MIHSEEFKKEAWEGVPAPKELKEVVERITQSYNINGLCDLGYIANIIAHGLGFGDGRSHFKKVKFEKFCCECGKTLTQEEIDSHSDPEAKALWCDECMKE